MRNVPVSFRIEAPSRLHFGLLSFGQSGHNRFGGVGLMIESPGLSLLAEPADRLVTSGPMADRIRSFADRWQVFCGSERTENCHLRLHQSVPQHAGLGTGTQLGLSVAAALYRFNDQPLPDAETLAASVGRAARSSVGTHGFIRGGLIFDAGKSGEQQVGRLQARLSLPEDWRVVLICPRRREGLSGEVEKQAFGSVPAVRASVTDRLLRRIEQELLPSASAGDLDSFGEAVYRYGYEAGMCFAPQQGGPFASEQIATWVQALRRRGIQGVGQSSWGPTVYALTPNASAASELIAWARRELSVGEPDVQFTSCGVANQGARCVID